nr:hypothetical protein [Kibdelosporangium sp. MJ126-NF4]CTQ92499.1 hypothetical protein [Kibdelosporangium sp. MJ126-NF4]
MRLQRRRRRSGPSPDRPLHEDMPRAADLLDTIADELACGDHPRRRAACQVRSWSVTW